MHITCVRSIEFGEARKKKKKKKTNEARADVDERAEIAALEETKVELKEAKAELNEAKAELKEVQRKLKLLEEKCENGERLTESEQKLLDDLRENKKYLFKELDRLGKKEEHVREKQLLLLRSVPSFSDNNDLAKQFGRMKLEMKQEMKDEMKQEMTQELARAVNKQYEGLQGRLIRANKTIALLQPFDSGAVGLLNVDAVFPIIKKVGVPANVPHLEVLDAVLAQLLVDGKEESAVQTLMVELLGKLCADVDLRLEDTHAKPVRGYPRRPDICVLEDLVILTIREVKLTVELKIKGLLRDASKQVEEYLREQANLDAEEHRMDYLGVGCDGKELQFCRLYWERNKWKFDRSKLFPLWEKNAIGGKIDLATYQLLFRALWKAKTLSDRTSVDVCSNLRQIVGGEEARFGLISAGARDDDDKQHHVVYWSDHEEGFILKGYSAEYEANRELNASFKARESLTDKLKRHVPVVETPSESCQQRHVLAEADSFGNVLSGGMWLVV